MFIALFFSKRKNTKNVTILETKKRVG